MDITIYPSKLSGSITAIPSKSQAHRLLICAAFSDASTRIYCSETNQDIEATVSCLNSIGAVIKRTSYGYHVDPVSVTPETAVINCEQSGSTLRFLLPIVCALGIRTTIHMSGRLPNRPLTPMWEELERMGCQLARSSNSSIQTAGKLQPGEYMIAGNISSQFITGLLFAMSLMDGLSTLRVTGTIESAPYVKMTQETLKLFGVESNDYCVQGSYPFQSPKEISVEGDWSNAAFFLAANSLGNRIHVENLATTSTQGDCAIASILAQKTENSVISAADIPDLVPILAVYFAVNGGAVFTDIKRLRLKESDRVESVISLLNNLGIQSEADENTLHVFGGKIRGGIVDSYSDHRIAMAAGIAATVASEPVTVIGADCVAKSYPTFWQEYKRLGGKYEQYLR